MSTILLSEIGGMARSRSSSPIRGLSPTRGSSPTRGAAPPLNEEEERALNEKDGNRHIQVARQVLHRFSAMHVVWMQLLTLAFAID